MKGISVRVRDGLASTGPVLEFLTGSEWALRQQAGESMFDFVVGNPHEMPIKGFADALQKWAAPQNKDWYAYKLSEPESRAIVARTLNDWRGVRFDEADICMTNGGFGGLQICLNAVVDPGDEVIINTPPWFFYELVITSAGGTAVRVPVTPDSFDLDVEGIAKVITPRTRAVIVNSPNNPTGKIYPPETLKQLASVLEDASRRHGRTIYLLSDEAYSRIVFDGQTYHSPTSYYPDSFLIYTYGKTLLTPEPLAGC